MVEGRVFPGQRREPGGRPKPAGETIDHNESDHVMNAIENKTKAVGEEKPAVKRRYLSAEKKYQLFLEAERGGQPLGEILRREGMYSSDLARIRDQVKEGALERLRARPGPKPQTVGLEAYAALKQELETKERALADLSVELAVLRKKTSGGTWVR